MKPTSGQLNAALQILLIVAECIREVREIPSGNLYARLMEKGMTLEGYNKTIAKLKSIGVIDVRANVIYWTGGIELSGTDTVPLAEKNHFEPART